MNKQEKSTIIALAGNLRATTNVKWESGDINKWAEWAKDMKITMRTTAIALEGLCAGAEIEKNNKEDSITLE